MKVNRTIRRIWVDPKEALASALKEFGNGKKLSKDQAKKLRKIIKKSNDSR